MNLNWIRWTGTRAPQQTQNPTLLFLHGLGGTGHIWRPITAALEDHFDCIAPDQRGHGQSRPVPEEEENRFHALDYAKDVRELLDDQQIERCIVIGHSMGVRTALALSTLVPGKITGLMALDLGMSAQWGGGMGIALSQFIQNLPPQFSDRASLKAYVTAHCPDPSIAQYLIAVSKKTFLEGQIEQWEFPFDHEALVKTIAQAHQAPIKEWLLKGVAQKIPFLFLHGQTSRVWSLADYEAQKKELEGPYAQFESWENAGHGLPFEQRARFMERVKTFATEILLATR